MGIVATESKIETHISKQPGICGGRSVILGTRMPVWSIIKWYKLGMSVEDIIREFPQLTPSQVHAAFSYYYDNQAEVEKDIIENEDETRLRDMV
jgi:type III restriction enzyme